MFGAKAPVNRYDHWLARFDENPIQEGMILLYGHSLFTRCGRMCAEWGNPNIEEEVRMKDGKQAIINHGFGGSNAEDQLFYYSRLVRPWKPRALLLACGGNDVSLPYSAKDVMELQARIIQWARADFPGIPIYCFNRTPSPSWRREAATPRSRHLRAEHNVFLEDFCARMENCHYIPLQNQAMFFENPEDIGDYNKVRDDIFVEDGHLNSKGYGLFMDLVRELLDDLL